VNTSQNPSQISRPTRLPRRGHAGGVRAVPIEPFNPGRNRFIKVRVNDEEHSKLTRLGNSEGGISTLIRRHLLGEGLADARREALQELARLCRSFNVIARETCRYEPARAVEILTWLVAIERELSEAIERLSKTPTPQ
jgi:hypothetical protein